MKSGVVAVSRTLSSWNEPLPASPVGMSVMNPMRMDCPAKAEKSTVTGVLVVWKPAVLGAAEKTV